MLLTATNRLFLSGFLILLVTLSFACSSGGDITSPTPHGESPVADTFDSIPVAVTDWDTNGNPTGGTGILGLYWGHIDSATLTAELTPLRSNKLADVLEVVDITGFLAVSPCAKCVKLISVEYNEFDEVVLHVGIKHPFPMGNPANPPTAANRADLIVYNVEGIIVADGLGTFNAMGQTVPVTSLKNADGYTGYLDSSLDAVNQTDSTVHPYVLHFNDYSAGNYNPTLYPITGFPPPPTIPSGNLAMGQGTDFDSRDYIFDLVSGQSLDFIYAVGCSYGITATTKNQRFTPEARVPQHNKKAASNVKVEVATNNMMSGDTSSNALLLVKVLDMNHGVSVGSGINQMLSASDVNGISVMVPGVMSAPVDVDNPTPISGNPRDPLNPLLYEVIITNNAGAAGGEYWGLVKVSDSYAPGQNQSPILAGKDGIKRVPPKSQPTEGLFAISEFATYQIFKVGVGYSCGPITGSIIAPTCPVPTFISGEKKTFEVTASSASGGDPIVLYEMDYDYDGTTFTVDAANTSGFFIDSGPFINPNCTGNGNPITITVAFRATDSCSPPNVTVFKTCSIKIDQCGIVLYLYKPDPARTSLIISDITVKQPVDPTGELDIGVCEAPNQPDYNGVYMFDKWQQICRFQLTYSNDIFQAPGLLPSNDTGTHPNPTKPMAGYRLDVAGNGYVVSSYYDMWESMDLSSLDPLFTDPFPEGDVWVYWKPTIPRPTQIPPNPGNPWPHNPILSLVDMDDIPAGQEHPLENPIAHDAWDESKYVYVSSPAAGDPNGSEPYKQVDNVLSAMFRYTNPTYMDPIYGYRFTYYGNYPPYYSGGIFYSLYSYAFELLGISADEVRGVDRSDKDWLYLAVSGPITQAAWTSGSPENLVLIDGNEPAKPGWLLDLNTALSLTTEHVLDVECIPYNRTNPIIFDNGTGGEAPQFAAIGAVLYSNKHIYLIAFDDTSGAESFILFQDIDGSSAITGTPKHLDIGENSMDIHVSSTTGTAAYVSVFKLTPQ